MRVLFNFRQLSGIATLVTQEQRLHIYEYVKTYPFQLHLFLGKVLLVERWKQQWVCTIRSALNPTLLTMVLIKQQWLSMYLKQDLHWHLFYLLSVSCWFYLGSSVKRYVTYTSFTSPRKWIFTASCEQNEDSNCKYESIPDKVPQAVYIWAIFRL